MKWNLNKKNNLLLKKLFFMINTVKYIIKLEKILSKFFTILAKLLNFFLIKNFNILKFTYKSSIIKI